MSVNNNKTMVLYNLESTIKGRGRVCVFDVGDFELLHFLCEGLAQKNNSNVKIWQCIEESFCNKYSSYVTRHEIKEVLYFYRMYDFSDKITVISYNHQYSSISNYVKTGILTKQEMVEALLYKL